MSGFCLRGGGAHQGVVVVVALAAAMALGACRASVPGGGNGAAGPGGALPGVTIARYAESLPITALAVATPYVWAGSERGLRRWKAAAKGSTNGTHVDVAAEPIGAETGFPGHRIDALGVDDEGAVWVASDAGVGRFVVDSGGRTHYQACAAAPPAELGTISWLLPTLADGGAWAGGAGGLARFDGRVWTVSEFLRDVPVTSMELDADRVALWVGTRGRGLFRVDGQGGHPLSPPGRSLSAADEIVGTAPTTAGARLVATRLPNGGRVTVMRKDGDETYETQSDAPVHLVRLLAAGAAAVLIAEAGGQEARAFDLRPLPRGESPPSGGFRLLDVRKGSTARYQAVPMALAVPADVTVAAAAPRGEGPPDFWCGSRRMGVAHADSPAPRYLGGDLTDDAERLSLACAARDRCYLVAGGAHAWLFDGARFQETTLGETAAGRALAVVADRGGALFGIVTDPPFEGINLTRLDGDRWAAVQRIPLGRRAARPSISFATFAPGGNLWLGLGVVGSDGQEQGRGALEVALASANAPGGAVIRHGNFSGAEASPESLPLPYDLTGVLFDGVATWFSARSGINRWQQSEFRHWGENEHMDSEVCYDVVKGSDGKIWAATSAGVGRFDGKEWRFGQQGPDDAGGGSSSDGRSAGGEAPATRALVQDGSGRMWLATTRGLRVLDGRDAGARNLPAGARIVDDDMLDLTLDRFGRVWALGAVSLAIADGGNPAQATTTGTPTGSPTGSPIGSEGGTR
jgi:hypothetical protein